MLHKNESNIRPLMFMRESFFFLILHTMWIIGISQKHIFTRLLKSIQLRDALSLFNSFRPSRTPRDTSCPTSSLSCYHCLYEACCCFTVEASERSWVISSSLNCTPRLRSTAEITFTSLVASASSFPSLVKFDKFDLYLLCSVIFE